MEPRGAVVAAVEHDGRGVFRRCSGGSAAVPRRPAVFNTDQGSQFTCEAFVGTLLGRARGAGRYRRVDRVLQ